MVMEQESGVRIQWSVFNIQVSGTRIFYPNNILTAMGQKYVNPTRNLTFAPRAQRAASPNGPIN